MPSLLPAPLKNPVVIIMAMVLLAVYLWAVFLRSGNARQGGENRPANLIEEDDNVNLRTEWQI
jgi:hypothetical protein